MAPTPTPAPTPRCAHTPLARSAAVALALFASACASALPPAGPALADLPRGGDSTWLGEAPATSPLTGAPATLVDFWHPTCDLCLASLPAVHALETRFAASGFRVVGLIDVDVDDPDELAMASASRTEHAMAYPTYVDPDGAWADAHDVRRLPTFVLVDAEGRVRMRIQDELREGTPLFDTLAAAIEALTADR